MVQPKSDLSEGDEERQRLEGEHGKLGEVSGPPQKMELGRCGPKATNLQLEDG